MLAEETEWSQKLSLDRGSCLKNGITSTLDVLSPPMY